MCSAKVRIDCNVPSMFLSRFQCSFYVRGTFPGENLRKIKFGASDMGIVNARRKVDIPGEN